jgi:hydrogenase maturation factor
VSSSSCDGDHCVTCSDEGVPMRVLESGADGLSVCLDAEGGRSEVMTELVGTLEPGDEVLVHAGVALVRLA